MKGLIIEKVVKNVNIINDIINISKIESGQMKFTFRNRILMNN
jgi:hypothetical protein